MPAAGGRAGAGHDGPATPGDGQAGAGMADAGAGLPGASEGGARGDGGGVAGCGAGLRGGEGAGLPKLEELFQAAEDAGEGSQNQGVQNLRQPAPLGATCRVVAQAGEMVGQRGESV